MQDHLSLVKQHTKEDHDVIVIDNLDIAKPASRKLEALSEIRDGSTGGNTQGYLTIEAAVLSESGKMPLPLKISARNVSAPSTGDLMPMTITAIS